MKKNLTVPSRKNNLTLHLLTKASIVFVCFSLFLYSCKKEEPPVFNITNNAAPLPAPLDSNAAVDYSVGVNYSVIVVSGNTVTIGSRSVNSTTDISGAVVTITQAGHTATQTTTTDGIVSFTGFFKGVIGVNITKTDYTTLSYLVTMNGLSQDSKQIDIANVIPLFKTKNDLATATITGRVIYENDLTNITRESVPQNTRVTATIDVANPTFINTFLKITNPLGYGNLQSGEIIQFAYESLFIDSTDANGNYTFTLPAATVGLPMIITTSDLVDFQKVFENTSVSGYNQTVSYRTLYSAGQTPSAVPAAGGAQVTFKSGVGATATASISGSGQISQININNGGTGYVAAPAITISGGGGLGATATANISGGVVTSITVTNAGSGYTSSPSISFSAGSGANVSATIGGTGNVVSIAITNSGGGYTTVPNVTISAPTGLGGTTATATATISSGMVNSITVTSAGSGYTSTPIVTIDAAPSGGVNAAAQAGFSGLPVQTVSINNPGTGYTGAPLITFSNPNLSSGTVATGTAQINLGTGQITGITITNPGSGYTSTPTVTVNAGSGANATAVFSGQVLTGITLTNGGSDYGSAPKVELTGGGGSGAQATAIVSGGGSVIGFTITNAGSGYTSAPLVSLVSGSGAQASITVSNGVVTNITVVNGGSGYTGSPEIVISPMGGGPGSGATATATVNTTTGAVSSITINSPGTGYIGGNTPSIAEPFSVSPGTLSLKPGLTYIRDINFGTGFRLP